jgi:hypothetical protein
LRQRLQRFFPNSVSDDHVRQILVEHLYAQPSGVLLGAACGILTAWGAASQDDGHRLADSAAILTVIAVVRVVVAYLLPRLKNFNTKALELIYELGAFSYAGMCGIIAAESWPRPPSITIRSGSGFCSSMRRFR